MQSIYALKHNRPILKVENHHHLKCPPVYTELGFMHVLDMFREEIYNRIEERLNVPIIFSMNSRLIC